MFVAVSTRSERSKTTNQVSSSSSRWADRDVPVRSKLRHSDRHRLGPALDIVQYVPRLVQVSTTRLERIHELAVLLDEVCIRID